MVAVPILPLLGIREYATLWKEGRFGFLIGVLCFLTTRLVGSIPGIPVAIVLALINIVLALISIAKRAAEPAIDVLADNDSPDQSPLTPALPGTTTAPGIVVYRLAATLFFANGTVFFDPVKRAVSDDVSNVVLDLEAVTDIDATGAESFRS